MPHLKLGRLLRRRGIYIKEGSGYALSCAVANNPQPPHTHLASFASVEPTPQPPSQRTVMGGGCSKPPPRESSPETRLAAAQATPARLQSLDEGRESVFSNYVIDTNSSTVADEEVHGTPKIFQKTEAVRALIRHALNKIFLFGSLPEEQKEDIINYFRPVSCAEVSHCSSPFPHRDIFSLSLIYLCLSLASAHTYRLILS